MPEPGEAVRTYAFPNGRCLSIEPRHTFRCRPDAYAGTVQAVADFRGAWMVPFLTFAELVAAGLIDLPNFRTAAVPHQSGMFIRLDEIALSARPPALHIELYR